MAKFNTKFCKPSDDGSSIIYGPIAIPPNFGAPSEAEYNAHGFYRNEIKPPQIPEGKVLASTHYVVQDNATVAVYTYEDKQYTLEDYDAAMEEHLQHEREARGYTSREPDSYRDSAHPRWKKDAEDWVAHRDAVMEYALGLINAVASGQMEPPTMEEFKAGLPKITWTYDAD